MVERKEALAIFVEAREGVCFWCRPAHGYDEVE